MKELVGLTNEDRCNQVHDRAIIPWCPTNTRPFCNLNFSTKRRGANTRDATISWGVAEREAERCSRR